MSVPAGKTSTPSFRIEVDGLRELQARLRAADKALPREIRLGLNEIVNVIMLPAIREKMESLFVLPLGTIGGKQVKSLSASHAWRTGKLLARTRATSQQRLGQITEGTAAQPYAGWWEFGGNTHSSRGLTDRQFIHEGRTLYPTLAEKTPEIRLAASRMMDHLADIANGSL